MSSPRDPDDRDGFGGPDDGSGWREPPHLGPGGPADPGDDVDRPNFAERRRTPRDDADSLSRPTWQPPGWDLPAAEPQRPVPPPADPPPPSLAKPTPSKPAPSEPLPQEPPVPGPPPEAVVRPDRRQGSRSRGAADQVFAYQGDLVGAQGWALQQGWTVTDGTAPEDAVLADVIATSPVRATKDHRAGNVLRGRAGGLELVAFDVVFASGRYVVPEYAVTAAPVLGDVPPFRLSPARFWRHRTGGLVPLAGGDPAFDARWLLLAGADDPRLHRLAQDPAVHALLLGTDDGDEFWSGAGHVAAVRPDGHRPQLLEHHARLLTAVVGVLGSGPH
ncbi:hypothetical protein DQ244_08355 [Blastococcus sp. TBT05-19]|uniref:hypothetical protein n=1 Tax=Blastococcus sp. TBT05-19 TaxID=2250581 RepID=UPI000DEB2B2F|nr:hypothetical protein [Blastococcus sp. TBT05-19]RBY92284.1 hypothetical protein DQ244_08355 [Blastococcus sp. TBT05-19]